MGFTRAASSTPGSGPMSSSAIAQPPMQGSQLLRSRKCHSIPLNSSSIAVACSSIAVACSGSALGGGAWGGLVGALGSAQGQGRGRGFVLAQVLARGSSLGIGSTALG